MTKEHVTSYAFKFDYEKEVEGEESLQYFPREIEVRIKFLLTPGDDKFPVVGFTI